MLSERHLLAGTLRHEFLHSLLEGETGVNSPLWLREGLVEAWSEKAPHGAPALPLSALDTALAGAATEAEAEAAHRAAAWYAARLLERYGREQVLTWLRSGIPAGVVTAFGQR
jgi:hypothetical protein